MQVECYDIEVVTGSQAGAGTTAHVYLELCGEGGASGEHRLMYREAAGRAAFAAGATDAFKLHCCPLGNLLKVRSGWVGKVGEAKGVWHGLCKFVQGCWGMPGSAWNIAPHLSALPGPHILMLPCCPTFCCYRCECFTTMQGPLQTGSCKRCGCAPLAPTAGLFSPAPAGWQCIRTTGKWLARDRIALHCMQLRSIWVAWQQPALWTHQLH